MSINKELVAPCAWSMGAGIIAGMVLMSYGFGYTGPNDVKKIVSEASDSAVVAALSPVCAADFKRLPDFAARMKVLVADKDDSWKQRDAFPDAMITLPGASYPNSDFASACAKIVLTPGKSAEAKP